MNANTIALIIPTMNRPDSLARTLRSYFAGSCIPSEIIVIDQSLDIEIRLKNQIVLESYKDRANCKYVYQKEPSLTAARNKGIKKAKSDILVFSDDDVDIFEDTIQKVKNVFLDDTISMLGGIDVESNQKEGILGCLFGAKSLFKLNEGHVTKSVLGRFPRKFKTNQVPTMWAMGFFFAVRNQLVKKWDLKFDEKLLSYAYAEDLDFTYGYYMCSKNENLRCIFDKDIFVRHIASKEYRIPTRKMTFMYVEHRYYLLKKHNIARTSMWYNMTNFLMFIKKVKYKEPLNDFIDAIDYLRKHKRSVIKGEFNYGEYPPVL